ncbi:hypothetical protein [Nocardia nova]|uniref:hypothetical protein n=1 Tax=Nocardia nova TaxID=37330 RepID=UPI0015E3688D|nr:hypothetical protein [Nocardia nova]
MTEAQRRELVRGARAATSTQAYALRCRIVLACAELGAFNTFATPPGAGLKPEPVPYP